MARQPTNYIEAQSQLRKYTSLRTRFDNPNKDTRRERLYDRAIAAIKSAFPDISLTADYATPLDAQEETTPQPLFDIPALANSYPISSLAPQGSGALPAPLSSADGGDSGLFGLSKQTVYLLGAGLVLIGVAFFFVLRK